MRTLLLSAILYLLGIAVVLLLRPKLMFHPDGRWKEFGTISSEHTIFPFWLFCFTWAILSYLLTSLITGMSATTIATTTAIAANGSSLHKLETPDDLVTQLPSKTRGRRIKESIESNYGEMKPGYYVLNAKGTKNSGVPKYIYIGEAPSEPFSTVGGGGGDSEEEEA